jgi:hypothetical protein
MTIVSATSVVYQAAVIALTITLACATDAHAQTTSSGPAPTPTSPLIQERDAALEGGAIGAVAGAYVAAWPVFAQGAGAGRGGALPWMAAGVAIGAVAGAAAGYLAERRWPWLLTTPSMPALGPSPSLLSPRRGQIDLRVEGMFGFTGPGSLARVREFSIQGTGLEFGNLGLSEEQIPGLDLRYWISERSAFHFRFRYFAIGGSHFLSSPAFFNGATIAGNQTLDTSPDWYAGGFYYEHSFRSWYAAYESRAPRWLQRWDLRGLVGIDFTYINFVIDGGHAPVVANSHGKETKEDFYHQSMPMPTIGVEAYRPLSENFYFNAVIQGNWINRWNSLRNEGGTVWASQSSLEAHLRIYFYKPDLLGLFQPMAGFFYYYYRQFETSSEDGNFLRWSAFGPEIGVDVSFDT